MRTIKYGAVVAALVMSLSAAAQTAQQKPLVEMARAAQFVAPLPTKVATVTTPEITVPVEGKTYKRSIEKPGTYYTAEKGYYNLVPGFAMTFDNAGNPTSYASNGIFGYIDRDLHFINRTPKYDWSLWDFYGDTSEDDTVRTHPLFTNMGYSITPKLTASLNGVDSLYQMGAKPHGTIADSIKPGNVSLAGFGFVYNVDVDATPFAETSYFPMDDNNPWNNLLFGHDTEVKPVYMEVFDKPCGGPVVLSATHFYVWTPTTVDLSNKTFNVTWSEENEETGEWEEVKKFTKVKPSFSSDQPLASAGIRLWEVYAVASDLSVMVDKSFSVMISGPQDGTQWALMCYYRGVTEADADEAVAEAMGNTAYYIATEGDYAGQVGQYMVQMQNSEQVLGDYVLHTSLDIHQRILSPYMLIADRATLSTYTESEFDLSTDGGTLECYLSDWYGGASYGVSITAEVTESTDGDWLTVTTPTSGTGTSSELFAIDFKASYLDIDTEGRRATVKLSDNKGFSRDIVIYQGDRDAADRLLSVEHVNAAGKAQVSREGDTFCVTYPEGCHLLKVYGVDGTCVAACPLTSEGTVNVSAADWAEGVYLFQLCGKTPQSLKVIK